MILTLSDVTGGNFTAEVKVDALRHVGEENAELYLVIYESGLRSDVNAGENVGKRLSHDYVVRYLSPAQLTGSGRHHKYELQLGADWNQANVGIAAFVKLRAVAVPCRRLKSRCNNYLFRQSFHFQSLPDLAAN